MQQGRVAWVVGATSSLGRGVARELSRRGYTVGGVTRNLPGEEVTSWGFSEVVEGAAEERSYERLLTMLGRPAVVFHAVGSGSVGQAEQDPAANKVITVGSVRSLVAFLADASPQSHLIYPSSGAVYGSAGSTGPCREDGPTIPVSTYGHHKLMAEAECHRHARRGGFVTILRIFSVYGAPQKKLLFWDLARRARSGERVITLSGSGNEARDFVALADVATVVAGLAETEEAERIVNVASGAVTSVREAAELFLGALDVRCETAFTDPGRPGDPSIQRADIRWLANRGLRPTTSLEQGLAEYARWLKAESLAGR